MDIVRFKGGLGNQMFQYAFLKSLEHKGRNVGASIGFYKEHPELHQFILNKVFPNIKMNVGFEKEFFEAYDKWCLVKSDEKQLKNFKKDLKNRYFWSEDVDEEGTYQENVYLTEHCVFSGYWQTEKYFIQVKKELLTDFQFLHAMKEEKLLVLAKKLSRNNNYISVHIRRGDYLQYPKLYGNICTEEYYQTAMTYFKQNIYNPIFVFFSDDADWVKKHYRIKNAIYIEETMFEKYDSWYDMYLMSCCSHNIIANSTFSWWGAWLNQKVTKQVIAPKKWLNDHDRKDICPNSWIRL